MSAARRSAASALHVLKYLPNLKRLSFYGVQRRNAGMCWAPVMTDIELDTIALLTGLEELNIGDGVALGAPKPAGSARGRARPNAASRAAHASPISASQSSRISRSFVP